MFSSTIGVVFLGTPFRGAHGALANGQILRAAQESIGTLNEDEKREAQIISRILEILEPGNEALLNILEDFLAIDHALPRMACFYETQPANVWKLVSQNREKVREICLGYHEPTNTDNLQGATGSEIQRYTRPSRVPNDGDESL